jgi:DNA-binding GntR family transcriptional regulator
MSRAKKDVAKIAEERPRKVKKPSLKRDVRSSPITKTRQPALADDRFSRTTWLANILRERILAGIYKPGERIREVQLRSEFGFSNGPIRESLQAIVADGLAERAPWHGVSVKTLSDRGLVELFQVRLALLEYAAELAARHPSEAMLSSAKKLKQELDDWFKEIERPGGHPSFNGKLSKWLLTCAGNKALHAIWDKTMQQTLIYVNASLVRSHGRKSRVLIDQLINSICAGDVSAARGAARALTVQTLIDLGIEEKL